MLRSPDLTTVALFDHFEFEDADEKSRVQRMLIRARKYLTSFDWSGRIVAEYVGLAVGDVIAVFLFKIDSAVRDVDEWIWVVDGDVPSAYLGATSDLRTPAQALDGYIGAAEEWINAVRAGRPVATLIPLRLPPDSANADALQERLRFFDREILPPYQHDL